VGCAGLDRYPERRVHVASLGMAVHDAHAGRGVTAPVGTRAAGSAVALVVADAVVIALLSDDVDPLTGATLESTAQEAAARLRTALGEAAELRTPWLLLRGVGEAVAITIVLCVVLWLLRRLDRIVARVVRRGAERRIGRSTWSGEAIHVTGLLLVLQRVVTWLLGACAIVVVYLWLAFVLRRFPYTRPWGESLRALLLSQVEGLGAMAVAGVPGLFTAALIVLVARAITKMLTFLFAAVEQGRLSMPGVYPDTATPMRRLVTAVVWLCALAMAYPYIPGSESPGFKGMSVFLGVVVSLGSTGVVQQLMSGLMLTFARAVHVGDYARIGDVEGTILQIGALATKLRTPYGEEITIPNAVVVTQTTTNYSKSSSSAALLSTSVTIGYDTPWRQVEGLLLTAARRTSGILSTPPPFVWHVALEDFYVKYTLLLAPEDPCRRRELLDQLHRHILDAFNEYDVQIMSPHYVTDPRLKKVVPESHWHEAPAAPRSPIVSESQPAVSVKVMVPASGANSANT
jgi:small-conductance mechanosensitive channel